MRDNKKPNQIIRWLLSVTLVVVGLSVTWAWGQVARLAEPLPVEPEPQPSTLYAMWPMAGTSRTVLYRSVDQGATWLPLNLPEGEDPVVWAGDGADRLAVALEDGSLLLSGDRGEHWTRATAQLPILSLAWGEAAGLYLGTASQGIYRLTADGTLTSLVSAEDGLATMPVPHLASVEGRLFAATPTVLFHTDDAAETPEEVTWTRSMPVPEGISALAAISREFVFVGTETSGVYESTDAGQSWQLASQGLGLAAGQMVKITALQADPREVGLLYAAVDYVLGSTQVHASAAGTFVTPNSGALWQPLAGPAFPEARQASDLVLVTGKPLYVQAVTAEGLQEYEPDVTGALAALEGDDPQARATAAHLLGLARVPEAGNALLAALDDADPAVSLAAANALGYINDPALASALLVALEHPDEQVRSNAARALGAMRVQAAVEPLRTMLLTGQGIPLSVAADALRHIGGPAATEALLTALADPHGTPRWHAAMAALEATGEEAVVPLTGMLDSQEADARRNAAEALGWIGSASATEALLETLGDDRALVREQAAWALGEIGDPAARTALERAQARDPSASVQLAAAGALARIEGQQVTAARWPASWAPTLNRLQPLRWSILGLALVGAVWLALGQKSLSPLVVLQRQERR